MAGLLTTATGSLENRAVFVAASDTTRTTPLVGSVTHLGAVGAERDTGLWCGRVGNRDATPSRRWCNTTAQCWR